MSLAGAPHWIQILMIVVLIGMLYYNKGVAFATVMVLFMASLTAVMVSLIQFVGFWAGMVPPLILLAMLLVFVILVSIKHLLTNRNLARQAERSAKLREGQRGIWADLVRKTWTLTRIQLSGGISSTIEHRVHGETDGYKSGLGREVVRVDGRVVAGGPLQFGFPRRVYDFTVPGLEGNVHAVLALMNSAATWADHAQFAAASNCRAVADLAASAGSVLIA